MGEGRGEGLCIQEEVKVGKHGGRLKHFVKRWRIINPKPTIISWIKQGYRLHFQGLPLRSLSGQRKQQFSVFEKQQILKALNKLLVSGAIRKCSPSSRQILSPFFLINKPNGDKRFILNLKRLNQFVKSPHFKMEDWRTVVKLLQAGWWMTTIDAFFLVPINSSSRRILRFVFEKNCFEFVGLPFGLSCAPYVFTKIMKAVVAHLHKLEICCIIYLDDMLILSQSEHLAKFHTRISIDLLAYLGLVINFKKSCLSPSQKCKFLGFYFDSVSMTISLPEEKKQRIISTIKVFLRLSECRIQFVAHLSGLLVSTLPAVKYGLLYLKNLERFKVTALVNANQKCLINSRLLKRDLKWWLSAIENASQVFRQDVYSVEIYTDASNTG